MITNQIEERGRIRKILVQRTEVKITLYKEKNIDKKNQQEIDIIRRTYQICTELNFGDCRILKCISKKGEVDFYNINLCYKFLSVPIGATIEYIYVAGQVFVKVIEDGKQSIYDEVGNLIESDTENDIMPIFSGCNIVIQKKNKSTGKVLFSNLEMCSC